MTNPDADLSRLRRAARSLARAFAAGDPEARARVTAAAPRPDDAALKHADYLHVIAREQSFASWPVLKAAVETRGMDEAQKVQRLKIAVAHGQAHVVEQLLTDTPGLARGLFGIEVALYDLPAVRQVLEADPGLATRPVGRGPALIQLCQSRMIHHWPDREADMLAIADLLLAGGADVNAGIPAEPGSEHQLSPLYFALGHAGNMPLARWLLEHGTDPDDGESLYHATELGHTGGVKLLIAHGADPALTNALPRAMDFDSAEIVGLLLEGGADPDEGSDTWVQGTGFVRGIPALHQAARRMCSGPVIDLLLAHGADAAATWKGCAAYAFARVFGNDALARRLRPTSLTETEALLAAAAEGRVPGGRWIDPAALPEPYRNLPREILHLPGKLPHIRALIDLGYPWDTPDAEGVTPVQAAGWSGLPEVMACFLALGPDLSHVNSYGGTLLSTIIHGSENDPERARKDHVACARLALEHGVALPKRAIDLAGQPDMAAFLADWAEAHPGAVVEHGVA